MQLQQQEEPPQHENIPQINNSTKVTISEIDQVAFDALEETKDEQHVNENTENGTHTSDDKSEETDSNYDDELDNNSALCSDEEILQKPSGCTESTVQEDNEYDKNQQHVTSNQVT